MIPNARDVLALGKERMATLQLVKYRLEEILAVLAYES